jgi:hypothetical protein
MTPAQDVDPAAPRRVLEDPSGRRLRGMRWAGRAVSLFFAIWLALVILGGVGVGPAAHVPFGSALRPTKGPPPLPHTLHPQKAAPADLAPARAAAAEITARDTPRIPATGTTVKAPGRTVSTPGAATATTTTAGSQHAHNQTRTTGTTPGRSATAPGRTKTSTSPGRSSVAPGHTNTTTTGAASPGRSATAPGKTKTVEPPAKGGGKKHGPGGKP